MRTYFLLLMFITVSCSNNLQLHSNYSAPSNGYRMQWYYEFNHRPNLTAVLDTEEYKMPNYCIKLTANPQRYYILNGSFFVFKYYSKQYVIVHYAFKPNVAYRDCSDAANEIGIEIDPKRISKVDVKDNLYIYYLNIIPKNVPFFEGTTASISW